MSYDDLYDKQFKHNSHDWLYIVVLFAAIGAVISQYI